MDPFPPLSERIDGLLLPSLAHARIRPWIASSFLFEKFPLSRFPIILFCFSAQNTVATFSFFRLPHPFASHRVIGRTAPQSKNWDGGKQEFGAALEALRRVVPEDAATVIENRVEVYPIRVIVTAETGDGSGAKTTEIWSGRQQALFSKYAGDRTRSMNEIAANLEAFLKTTDSSKL